MKSKEQSFYLNLSENPPTAGFYELLQKYSKVPKEETYKHIEQVVRLSYAKHGYMPTNAFNRQSVTKLGSITHIRQLVFMSSITLV